MCRPKTIEWEKKENFTHEWYFSDNFICTGAGGRCRLSILFFWFIFIPCIPCRRRCRCFLVFLLLLFSCYTWLTRSLERREDTNTHTHTHYVQAFRLLCPEQEWLYIPRRHCIRQKNKTPYAPLPCTRIWVCTASIKNFCRHLPTLFCRLRRLNWPNTWIGSVAWVRISTHAKHHQSRVHYHNRRSTCVWFTQCRQSSHGTRNSFNCEQYRLGCALAAKCPSQRKNQRLWPIEMPLTISTSLVQRILSPFGF